METIKQHVHIPEDRRVHIDLKAPDSIKSGDAEVLVIFQSVRESRVQKRKLGIIRGKVFMSDDFDEPLPDSFWLGED